MTVSGWEERAQGYLNNGFQKIHGWSSSRLIYHVLEAAQRYQLDNQIKGSVAEIGVHHGKLFLYLDQLRDKAEEYAVAMDIFDEQSLNIDASGHGSAAIFQEHIASFSQDPGTVITLTGDSTCNELKTRLQDLKLRFRIFSIDGGHTVWHTVNDLKLAEQALTNGGVVLLDDVFTLEWAGVTEGVYEYLAQKPTLIPVVATQPKLMFTTLSHAQRLREHVKRSMGKKFRLSVVDMAGHEVIVVNKAPSA